MDSLNRIFGLINEAKKKKKGMVGPTPKGKANRYDSGSFGMQAESSHMKKKLNKKDFKMLRGESSEIVTVLSILKEAYQDELISEEAFLAIADPIMRSLMNEVTFPDTYEKEDLDDAEDEGPKKVVKGTKKPKVSDTAEERRKRRHAEASDKRSMNPGK